MGYQAWGWRVHEMVLGAVSDEGKTGASQGWRKVLKVKAEDLD